MRSLHQRGRETKKSLSQFISSLFDGVGQLLPGDFAGLLMCRPRLLAAGDSCCQKVLQRFSWSIQGVEWTTKPSDGHRRWGLAANPFFLKLKVTFKSQIQMFSIWRAYLFYNWLKSLKVIKFREGNKKKLICDHDHPQQPIDENFEELK